MTPTNDTNPDKFEPHMDIVKYKVEVVTPADLRERDCSVQRNGPQTVRLHCDPKLTSEEIDYWFRTGSDSQGQPMGLVTGGNMVRRLIRGEEAFPQMVWAMQTAKTKGHFIFLLGWILNDDFVLHNNATAKELFSQASDKGVQVRAMLWDQFGTQNTKEVQNINDLECGAAILDDRTLNFYPTLILGVHHQKILVVNGSEGLIAFCGGMDISKDRIESDVEHGFPMHDTHCCIKGPAAYDLLKIFTERWNDHPDHNSLDYHKPMPDIPSAPGPIEGGREYVQIARTYGNGSEHWGIDTESSPGEMERSPMDMARGPKPPRGYTFLNGRKGEQTIKEMVLHAIKQAQSFIYMEDQYLVSLEIRDALKEALGRLSHLTILIPHNSIMDDYDVGRKYFHLKNYKGHPRDQSPYRRQQFIKPLREAGGDKVRVFYLDPPGQSHTYVHSKTWIFDDQFAIIGSANCNLRGYTHDSEVTAGICDSGSDSGCTLWFPRRLRMALWAKHLNMEPAELIDGVASACHWLSPLKGAHVKPYDEDEGVNLENHPSDWLWEHQFDPDGS